MIGLVRKVADSYKRWNYINENKWQDLVMGDVVEINGKMYMYWMLDKNGGPGHAGRPEPVFTTEKPKAFIGISHGTGPIIIKHEFVTHMRPIEIHLKEDGTLDDKPSVCIIMSTMIADFPVVAGQLSLKMWNEALKDIGYEIKKIEEKV